MSAEPETPAGGSRSVDRALRLLHVVASEPRGVSLTAATRAVELPTSTVARLLRTLENTGYATRDAHGLYRPGVRILQAGAIAIGGLAIYSVSEPHLRELAEATGETAYLAVEDGRDAVVYLRQVESPRAIRHATWTGRAIPSAGTAVGAAISGRVTEAGFVTSRATAVEPDAAAAAAPVRDATGAIVAAISIIGPSFRLPEDELQHHGAEVGRHADTMSAELGYPGAIPEDGSVDARGSSEAN